MKVYSGLDSLPDGLCSEHITKGCMVLEGGSFRGLYSCGVLDALMLRDINMECTAGVSAGAMFGIGYALGRIGYAARLNLTYRHDKRYVGTTAIKNNKGVIGFDFAFSAPGGQDELDFSRITALKRRFVAAATNCLTGKTEYFEADGTRKIIQAIRASASMPFLSKMVDIGGKPYLDGGCSCKIPYRWALHEGYEKIIIVKTRPEGFRKEINSQKSHAMTKLIYGKYPEFCRSLIKSDAAYNRQCDEIDRLGKEKRAFVLAPSGALTVGRLEGDMEKLGALYRMGYDDAMSRMDEIKEYLGIL